MSNPEPTLSDDQPWYSGITRYQWTVLIIASLGWVFDIFEGQIFVASMNEAMPSLVPAGTTKATIDLYNMITLAMFLLGGALGGVLFGMLSDRIGRKKTMSLTIIMYSLFTCVSAFSQEWWHMAGLRFLVAMGVGGEWAVASTLVAEVFPKRARARVSGIFHASSVFGTFLAVAAGSLLIGNERIHDWANAADYPSAPWRIGFGVGVLPALLIIWIRRSLKEPEGWEQAKTRSVSNATEAMGRIPDLFRGELLRPTLVGVTLAAVGLATFWGAHIFGKDLMRRDVEVERIRELLTLSQRKTSLATITRYIEALKAAPTDSDEDQAKQENEEKRSALKALNVLRQQLDANTSSEHIARGELLRLRGQIRNWQSLRQNSDFTKAFFKERRDPVLDVFQEHDASHKRWEMLGMLLVTTGGGLGLLCFGPLSERVGRKSAFLVFHVAGLIAGVVCFQFATGVTLLLVVLPVFGFLTLGMHAGYAIYFPELYPTRLRGTGAGFCFNFGRILAAPILIIRGKLRQPPSEPDGALQTVGSLFQFGLSLEDAASALCVLFLIGVVVLVFAPETRGRDLT